MTAVAISQDDTARLAIGLENGVVLLLKGDLAGDRFKTKVVHEGSTTITGMYTVIKHMYSFQEKGLGFVRDKSDLYLSIVSRSDLVYLPISFKGPKKVYEDQGADVGCSIFTPELYPSEVILAKKDVRSLFFLEERLTYRCLHFMG